MSITALYYPNVTVVDPRRPGQSQDYTSTDTSLLTTAVLLWDSLEVIVPWKGFSIPVEVSPSQRYDNDAIHDAFELVVRSRALTSAEKVRLKKELENILSKGIPDFLRFHVRADNFNMYPEKLSPEIWEMLYDAGLTSDGTGGFHGIQRDFGLIIMGMIADICAGNTKRKVTNYQDAHEGYTRLIAAQAGIEAEFRPNLHTSYNTFASIALKAVDATEFPLSKLVALRKREAEDGLLPVLRRNYRNALEKYVSRLSVEAESPSDIEQIEHEFASEIRDDFRHLREMLRLERRDFTLNRGGAVLASLFSGKFFQAVASALGVSSSYQLKEQQLLEKHPSAWLHVSRVSEHK